jgi:hypothetical protein
MGSLDPRQFNVQYHPRLSILTIVTWIGLNDIDRGLNITSQLTKYFEVQETLYNAGARTFLFMKLPPVDRSPFGTLNCVSS